MMVIVQSSVEMSPVEEHPSSEEGGLIVSPSRSRKPHLSSDYGFPDFTQPWSTQKIRKRIWENIYIVLVKAKINVLLPFGPLAILLHYLTGKHGLVFLFSLVGITPLAERLGYATEQLAFFTGPTVGGLLNATFGNATEMIISIYALKSGMIRVVQQSLLGSILSNMLLVLGCAFFCGGIRHRKKNQHFTKETAVVNSGLLLMAVMGILFPAVLHFTHTEVHFGKSELALSRFSSCIMLLAYASYLLFQLKSRPSLYNPIDEEIENNVEGSIAEDEEHPEISLWEAICWLAILTAWISILSGYLVDAIQIPFCVVVGWIMEKPMDLNFQLFETATLFITVLVVTFMLQEGTSNYFKGLMLIFCYLIVAASFFVHVDPKTSSDD